MQVGAYYGYSMAAADFQQQGYDLNHACMRCPKDVYPDSLMFLNIYSILVHGSQLLSIPVTYLYKIYR